MLKNSESDAEPKNFYVDVDSLVIEHSQMKTGSKMYYQIYQTHDWINPYMGSPATDPNQKKIVPKLEEYL